MNGFIFKVSDLCHDEKGTFFRGKYFGGKVRSKEKILLVSPDRRIDTLFDNKQIHVVDLLINQEYGTDYLYIDVPFVGDNVSLKDDALWVVDSDLSSTSMVVYDSFIFDTQEVVLTGIVNGSIRIGDDIIIISSEGISKPFIVKGLEKNKRIYNQLNDGENAGVLLKGVTSQVPNGSIMCSPPIKYFPAFLHDNVINEDKPATDNQLLVNKKVALLVGNCDYHDNAKLKNCINDASAYESKLKALGFRTIIIKDGNKETIDKAINEFSIQVRNADVGLFFYSGHGIQLNGENYLIPIDAEITSPADIDYRCNRASYVLSKMEDVNCSLKIMILDACRTNPFTRGWFKGYAHEGLGSMNATTGTIIAFATSPNCVAYDGEIDGNSPYMYGLLEMLKEPHIEIVNYFSKVSAYVYKLTNEQQKPWFSCSALTGDFYFTK